MDKYGIKETQDVLKAVVSAKEAYKLSVSDDGKVTFPKDLFNFVGAGVDIISAIDGIGNVPNEIGDLTDSEIAQLGTDFGKVVNDPRYQRAFVGLAMFADAVKEIANNEVNEN